MPGSLVGSKPWWLRSGPPGGKSACAAWVRLSHSWYWLEISPEVIGLVVLPPLLYASAEELSWRELRLVWKPVGVLAVGLVLTSAAAVGAVASAITPLSWQMALVLGAVLAGTDPVAVTALGRRLALPPKVQVLVQAESLFNDATSLVLFLAPWVWPWRRRPQTGVRRARSSPSSRAAARSSARRSRAWSR